MKHARDKFLAGAAFAQNQNGAISIGDALNHSQHGVDLGRSPDDLVDLKFFPELLLEVEIFGNNISVTEVAKKCNTIPYEILTGISQRVKRIYIEE